MPKFIETENYLKALAEETRLKIVTYLTKETLCVCELVTLLAISQPSVSQHLKRLKEMDIITEERRGKWIYYSLNRAHTLYPLLLHLISTMPILTIDASRLKNICK